MDKCVLIINYINIYIDLYMSRNLIRIILTDLLILLLSHVLFNLKAFAERYLAWEDDYIQSKFMPLVTRWHLLHDGGFNGLTLEEIVKRRSLRSVSSYELLWQHDSFGKVTTVEPAHLVAQVYPELHEAFVKSKEKPKKGTYKL